MSSPKYKKIMEPLIIRGKVLKNRLEASNSLPHFLQGPEPFPADTVIAHFENKARSAAIVTCMGINNGTRGKKYPMFMDMGHFPDYDLYDTECQNYLLQLADAIHFYGSLACMSVSATGSDSYPLMKYRKKTDRNKADQVYDAMDLGEEKISFSGELLDDYEIEGIPAHLPPSKYTEEMLSKIADSLAEQAYILKKLDWDMINVHMSYRNSIMSQFFSPLMNHRTDEWGGTYDNRKKFPLMVLKRIRERVGNNFLIELQWTSDESMLGGYGLDESARFLNEAKEYIDIVQLRGYEVDPSHPTGFEPRETPFADDAYYMKQHVPGLIISTIGGNFYPDTCEKLLEDGKADIIGGARAYISNPDYGQLVKEGRDDDIVPCLRCNKCHGRGVDDPLQSVCSVNPVIGLEQKAERMGRKPDRSKRVAIIGGGPAGMRCAMFLKERGHEPVIFEKSGQLGGTIKHSDYVSFKWPLQRFKDFLIYQMDKQKIEVRLDTLATPDMIEKEDFDVVVTALGANPVLPPINGIESVSPVFYEEAFANPENLGHNVVIVGGGDVGVEIGIYLARKGHSASVVEMRDKLAADATVMHYLSVMRLAWQAEPDFHEVTSAKVIRVSPQGVTYLDSAGNERFLEADSIVFSCGMKSDYAQSLSFYGSAREFYSIGDCARAATIQQAMRSAYGVARQI